MTTRTRVALLGDSIAYGTGAERYDDRLGPRLADLLHSNVAPVDVQIFAVPGATSAGLAAQARQAAAAKPDVAVIVVGANDLARLAPPPQAAAQLAQAVAYLRLAGAEVVVATAPDLSVVPGCPPAVRDLVRSACEQYAALQDEAAARAGAAVARLGAELATYFARDPALFALDRYHPSAAGYALIAQRLAPYIERAVRRRHERAA